MKQAQHLDPCKRCFLQGTCDPDECGRHLFELDTNKKPKQIIEVSLVLDTLTGYQDGEKISFYGESARALWGLCHTGISYEHDDNYLGASLVVNSRQFETISPKAVKNGYKIKIIKGKRT